MTKTYAIVERIMDERRRQTKLVRAGKIEFDLAQPSTPVGMKLAVLMEEVGEVAHEVNENTPSPADLKEELIQVAAVAAAWAESL